MWEFIKADRRMSMTENEIKNTKEWFKDFIENYALSNQETIEFQKAVACLEEIQQYRAIGTVEEVKNAYGRGYNQGSIDRAEELQKCREYGYNKAIDEFVEALKEEYKPLDETDADMCKMVFKRFDKIAEQLKGDAE